MSNSFKHGVENLIKENCHEKNYQCNKKRFAD